MPNIKKTIYREAKKIAKTTELDITPEELASLTLFKVMNLPYFENVNDFLSLHYNIFDEISVGNIPLNNVKGYTNSNLSSFVVKMDMKESVEYKFDVTNQILKKEHHELLKDFINIINTAESFDDLMKKIEKKQDKDVIYLNKLMKITSSSSYDGSKLVRAIEDLISYDEKKAMMDEFNFERHHKLNYYRRSHLNSNRSIDFVFDNYQVKDASRKPLSEVITNLRPHDVAYFTGIQGYKLEDLDKFEKNHPDQYNNSLYKIFKENETQAARSKAAFELFHFSKEVKIFTKMYKKMIENNTAEHLIEKYNDDIQKIIKVLAKNYPQITKNRQDSECEIKTFTFNTASQKDSFINKEHPLEIFQSEYKDICYPSVRGFGFYKQYYRAENGIYVSAHNGLEEIASVEGYERNDCSAGGHRMQIKNFRINRLYDAGRDLDIATKQTVIEEFVKMAEEKKCPFVYDIFERDHPAQEQFNNDMRVVIKNLQEQYKDVIFINDGVGLNDKEALSRDMKCEVISTLVNNNIDYDKILLANKYLENFFKKDSFNELANLDYFERKKDTLTAQTINDAIKIATETSTKNKPKVSL
jgi:hypothetical protein